MLEPKNTCFKNGRRRKEKVHTEILQIKIDNLSLLANKEINCAEVALPYLTKTAKCPIRLHCARTLTLLTVSNHAPITQKKLQDTKLRSATCAARCSQIY